jgi:catechol 2,3-dioxygenase-like lactoylglutathione lyase family enzyme
MGQDGAMLATSDIVAFVATTDLPRARSFYATTLGLPLLSEDPYACVFDAHGTHLRVNLVDQPALAPYTVLGWSVADIALTIGTLAAGGVVFQRFDGMDQDDLGVWRAPGGALVAWFKDPDGHTLSLTQDA